MNRPDILNNLDTGEIRYVLEAEPYPAISPDDAMELARYALENELKVRAREEDFLHYDGRASKSYGKMSGIAAF